jgi:hypothetical protein
MHSASTAFWSLPQGVPTQLAPLNVPQLKDLPIAGESNTIRIGYSSNQTTTFIAGISDTVVTGTAVL